jgi:hypothetical protein
MNFCPRTGSIWFRDIDLARRDLFLADLLAAKLAMQDAMVEGTNAKQARAWFCFNLYLTSIGYQHDPFLESLSRAQRHRILAAFAHAVR